MNRLKIGEKWVGEGEPVYIVAEAGSNHNGSFEQALRLIEVAAEAGVDAVKFQNFKAARMYPRTAGQSCYLKVERPIYDIIRDMEMPEEWVPELVAYCHQKGLEFLSSPFDEASADLLDPHVVAFKVASYEMTHVPLLRHIARFGKPMVVSTGTASLEEVVQSVEVIVKEGNEQIVLLQCTASYPAPPETVNARAMLALREATGFPVGLSDHSRDPIVAPVVATSLGACLVEKHFTLSNRLPGPDHVFALEPAELTRMVEAIRAAERMLGDGRKVTLPIEQELFSFARRSIFATRAVQAGETLSQENVAVLRCGNKGSGLPPAALEAVVGRRAAQHIAADSPITMDLLA